MSDREFWMRVYIACCQAGLPPDLAKASADQAWRDYRLAFRDDSPARLE